MSLPWVNHYITHMFMSPAFIALGVAYFFEGLRRGYLGGLSLGLFMDLSTTPPGDCTRDLNSLRAYLDKEKDALEAIPQIAWPLIGPWIDHHNAVETFYEIAMELCIGLHVESCQDIWDLP